MLAQNQKKASNINNVNHDQFQIEIHNLRNIWQTVFLDFRINRVPKQFSFNFKGSQTKHIINFILISQGESVEKVFYLLLTFNLRQKSVNVELAIIFLVQRQIFSFIAFKQKIGLKICLIQQSQAEPCNLRVPSDFLELDFLWSRISLVSLQ